MLFLILFIVALFIWPKFILYMVIAPFFGAIVGGLAWAITMLVSGGRLSFSSAGVFLMAGMILSLILSIIWAKNNNL